MKKFTFVINEKEAVVIGTALTHLKQIISDCNSKNKTFGVQLGMFSGGIEYTKNHELLEFVEKTHDNINEQRNNIDLDYVTNPSDYFLWQKIYGFKLIDNCSYWIAYGHNSGDVRKCWYAKKYNCFYYKGGGHCADNPYQVSFNEVKYIMPVFEPERPTIGDYSITNTY